MILVSAAAAGKADKQTDVIAIRQNVRMKKPSLAVIVVKKTPHGGSVATRPEAIGGNE